MVSRNHTTDGAYTRNRYIKTALGIGRRARPRLISVSARYIFAWNIYRHGLSLACFFSHCYTCIKTSGESGILSSIILEKLAVLLEFERYAVGYIFLLEVTTVVL